jgi:DtxR family Mn-dependent transcriptional regulator
MLSDNLEEYLEVIWVLEVDEKNNSVKTGDIAERLNVAPSSVNEMLNKLSELGYLHYRKYYGVSLTEEGKTMARNIVRRHRLAERLLVDILNIPKENIERVACGFEHSINAEVEEEICKLLKHPALCPHGNVIPKGECCTREEPQNI